MPGAALAPVGDRVCPTPEKKLSFDDEKSAIAGARVQGEKFLKPYRPYECDPGCGKWHLTTKIFGDFRDGHLTDRPELPAALRAEMDAEAQQAVAAAATRAPARRTVLSRPAPAASPATAPPSAPASTADAGSLAGSIQGASIDDVVRLAAASGDRQCEAIAARMRRDAAFLYTLLEDLAQEAQAEAEAAALREQLEAVESKLRDSRAARAVRQTVMADGKAGK
jgi:hypothetical protein